ncbi:MAG: hypothetical protein HQ565_09830 [Bacteroidetes bacterium]|nr:hypothetical protein [Bacteroidota bacterium]
MEDYIYILIGVIWLAASIYKATQKKKQKAQQAKPVTSATPGNTPGSEARSLLEELLGGQQVNIPEPAVIETEYSDSMLEEAETNKAGGSFQSEYANLGHKGLEALSGEGVSSLGNIPFHDIMKEQKKKTSVPGKIDLRKAIIYSAILERPYS